MLSKAIGVLSKALKIYTEQAIHGAKMGQTDNNYNRL